MNNHTAGSGAESKRLAPAVSANSVTVNMGNFDHISGRVRRVDVSRWRFLLRLRWLTCLVAMCCLRLGQTKRNTEKFPLKTVLAAILMFAFGSVRSVLLVVEMPCPM